IQPWAFDALSVSTASTLVEMIGFVASTVSRKSSLSATSAFQGGGVPGGTGTGATTHTDPTDILIIPIRPSAPATDMSMVAMAMVPPGMVTNIATHLGVTTAPITAARTTKMTMKVLRATFWPNAQLLGTAIICSPSVVSSLKTLTT